MQNIGVTFPKGFKAAGVACGIKKNGGKDLAVVCSDVTATAAAVFTTNIVKGHSLQLSMEHIKNATARAIVINSGNANACVGEIGFQSARTITGSVSTLIGCTPEEVLINSTGVIGVPLKTDLILQGVKTAFEKLSYSGGPEAAEAIMTTDTFPKQETVEFELDGCRARIGGMAKGSGMIHPNMATMIGVITTDINISKPLLHKALKQVIKSTFNRTSVDGDTSVCDMVAMLANGMAGNRKIEEENEDFEKFVMHLNSVCTNLARLIAKDGEGATKLIEIKVNGAPSEEDAYKIVSAVAKSPLVKTAIFGEDANWGRIITAAGCSGAVFNPEKVDIYIGDLIVCNKGTAVNFDEDKAKNILSSKEVCITIDLNQGNCSDRMWTCDFSYDYVKINGSYRS